jgi:hypothetical protein
MVMSIVTGKNASFETIYTGFRSCCGINTKYLLELIMRLWNGLQLFGTTIIYTEPICNSIYKTEP